MNTPRDPQTQLPLTEATYFILLSLVPGASHGYAMMKEVQRLSQGRVTLSTGTLYTAIKRLLEQGWIDRVEEDNGEANGRQRKAYRLTDFGRRVLEAEVARLEGLVDAAQLRILRDS